MSDLSFVPFELPKSDDGKYMALLTEEGVLKTRRAQFGLTQHQVADMAGIRLSQYQRLESGEKYISGTSMRIGLAVCAVLMLDPYEFLSVRVLQPDPNDMKPVPLFQTNLLDDILAPKKAGRKPLRKEITTVFVNYDVYSFLIPYDILNKLGEPKYIQMQWNIDERRIVFRSAEENEDGVLDVPEQKYEKSLYAIPSIIKVKNPVAAMEWGNTPYAVESRLVRDHNGTVYVMIDLQTAQKADIEQIEGMFVTPECFTIDG